MLRNAEGRLRSIPWTAPRSHWRTRRRRFLSWWAGRQPKRRRPATCSATTDCKTACGCACAFRFPSATVELAESLRVVDDGSTRALVQEITARGVPAERELTVHAPAGQCAGARMSASLDLPPAKASAAGRAPHHVSTRAARRERSSGPATGPSPTRGRRPSPARTASCPAPSPSTRATAGSSSPR